MLCSDLRAALLWMDMKERIYPLPPVHGLGYRLLLVMVFARFGFVEFI